MSDLLWNNICLLSKMEESYLNSVIPSVATSYFGLGRENDLQNFFKDKDSQWSVVVSTDTEIFHDPELLQSQLEGVKVFGPERVLSNEINQHHHFKPFIVIPLVMVVNTRLTNLRPSSLKDLCSAEYKDLITYGGPHNSAGKSLLKAIWSLYGKNKVETFLDNSTAQSMPAVAFKSVMDGRYPIAVVPTIFAARSGQNGLVSIEPSEGAVAIPSYVAIRKSCDEKLEQDVTDKILNNMDFHKTLYTQGKIVSPLIPESQMKLYYPPEDFFKTLDYKEFKALLDLQRS